MFQDAHALMHDVHERTVSEKPDKGADDHSDQQTIDLSNVCRYCCPFVSETGLRNPASFYMSTLGIYECR